LDDAQAQDGHLRLVDDGRAEQTAIDAGIGEREGAALDLFRAQLAHARAVGEVGDRALQAEHVLLLGVADDRHDEPPVERRRDATMCSAIFLRMVVIGSTRAARPAAATAPWTGAAAGAAARGAGASPRAAAGRGAPALPAPALAPLPR